MVEWAEGVELLNIWSGNWEGVEESLHKELVEKSGALQVFSIGGVDETE